MASEESLRSLTNEELAMRLAHLIIKGFKNKHFSLCITDGLQSTVNKPYVHVSSFMGNTATWSRGLLTEKPKKRELIEACVLVMEEAHRKCNDSNTPKLKKGDYRH